MLQITVCCLFRAKPLSEPILAYDKLVMGTYAVFYLVSSFVGVNVLIRSTAHL